MRLHSSFAWTILSIMVLATSCGSGMRGGTASRQLNSGINGIALAVSGPPVLIPDEPQQGVTEPFANAIIVVSPCVGAWRPPEPGQSPSGATGVPCIPGNEIERITAGKDGRFTIALPPGKYLLYGLPAGYPKTQYPLAKDVEVEVSEHNFTEAEVKYVFGV